MKASHSYHPLIPIIVVATAFLAGPHYADAQVSIPGSDGIDSEWSYSYENGVKQRESFTLDVRWDVVDRGATSTTAPKAPPIENVCAAEHPNHAQCPVVCGIHDVDVTLTEKNNLKRLPDEMARATRNSRLQNFDIGSQDLSFESKVVPLLTTFERMYGGSTTVTGKASRAHCAFTSHTWERHRYVLHIHWDWYRTVQTLTTVTVLNPKTKKPVTINQWSAPVTTGPLHVNTDTDADIMQVVKLDPASDKPSDIVVCHCRKSHDKTPDDNRTLQEEPDETSVALATVATTKGEVLMRFQKEVVRAGTFVIGAGPKTTRDPVQGASTYKDLPRASLTLGDMKRFVLGWLSPQTVRASVAERQVSEGFGTLKTRSQGVSDGKPMLAGLRVAIVATGQSTGPAFQLAVLNAPEQAISMNVPDGLVLEPLKDSAPTRNPAAGATFAAQKLTGYCLDFAKLPPQAGMQYRIADDVIQQQYAPIARIIRAAGNLAAAGQLHADSDPALYADSVAQLAIWATLEHWTRDELARHVVDLTRQNVEARGVKWTADLERLTRQQLVPARLQDVTAVEAEAQRLALSR